MNKTIGIALAAFTTVATSGCATTGTRIRPVDVTRFHLGEPIAPASFSIEPLSTNVTVSPEFQTYGSAVARELEKIGFRRSATPSDLIVAVAFTRASRGFVEKRPPVSIGIGAGGGGGYRGGLGLGGGLGFGLGGGQREVVGSELAVQIRRRSDGTTIWEGRAITDSLENTPGAQPVFQADRLANAMFRNFPGESGITTTVR
ncbi:DUF4136 domain-containing protein [Sphingomonas sp. CFBP 13720]|uniref:DUF4136 domain-containing protein n=1 Tax=Sphingomonas sp. CFBP 13720 TaxID=2775302 RepID=UPI00177E7363|nr:DUF4136 domain-containing protein [Sphingomonas sp. CFBP 13720]MBD8679470.1 DUF4136 domain-containing protein [Sphingomonas sp. CFBP 13720]